jgi:L-lactate dehydrogenase complex protein LldG
MSDAKAKVLEQIQASLKTAHLPAARATIPPRSLAEAMSRDEMVERFQRELEPIGGESFLAQDEEQALEILLGQLREVNAEKFLGWADEEIPLRGFGEAMRANSYARVPIDVPYGGVERSKKLMELASVPVGITGALAGLADTGSLALDSGRGHPRLASLLPPTHIAILPVSRLYPTMATFFDAHPQATAKGSNLVFVTGPSRTADIELTLQRGVHGPKFLQVILVVESQARA